MNCPKHNLEPAFVPVIQLPSFVLAITKREAILYLDGDVSNLAIEIGSNRPSRESGFLRATTIDLPFTVALIVV